VRTCSGRNEHLDPNPIPADLTGKVPHRGNTGDDQ